MSSYDSAECLSRLIERLRLPVDDTGAVLSQEPGTSTASLYRLLSEAESAILDYIAARVPSALISAPILLTSSDGGYTYDMKDGNGTVVYAQGHVRVYVRLEDIPSAPLTEGVDYTLEGDLLRVPNNRTWSFANGPYVQAVNDPIALSASVNPTIPVRARDAMIAYAAAEFCDQGGIKDPSPHRQKYQSELLGLMTTYRNAAGPANHQSMRGSATRRQMWSGGG